jgi:hypothetical protein
LAYIFWLPGGASWLGNQIAKPNRDMMNSTTYYIKSSVGKFKVKQYSDKDYEFLQIGGKNFCVMLRWLKQTPHPEEVELQWLDTFGMHCEMSGIEIRREKTIHLFQLSVTLLKKYNPNTKRLTLLDNSKISCTLPDGSTVRPSLKHFYFLFHHQTWYEAKFRAYPSADVEKYEKVKKNFENPAIKKPFRFNNPDLEDILQPLYEKATNWEEFLDGVAKLPNYCAKTYPWYIHAVSAILEAKTMIPDNWIIDITPDIFPTISYERLSSGGRMRTKKASRIQTYAAFLPDTPDLSKMAELQFH